WACGKKKARAGEPARAGQKREARLATGRQVANGPRVGRHFRLRGRGREVGEGLATVDLREVLLGGEAALTGRRAQGGVAVVVGLTHRGGVRVVGVDGGAVAHALVADVEGQG